MKKKNDPFEIGKMEKKAAEKKKDLDMIEKDEARRKKETDRMAKEAAKKEMDATKKEFGLEKNRIALERLQLNWIKWNITCMALGFTAYKFYHSRVDHGESPIGYYITGRDIGIFLSAVGLITLLFATLQHKKSVAQLKLQYEAMHYSMSLRLSYIIMVFSIVILFVILVRG